MGSGLKTQRIKDKEEIQERLVKHFELCAVPIWPNTKVPAYADKEDREDQREWYEIAESDKGKLYDMNAYDLGIKGTIAYHKDNKPVYFMWADFDVNKKVPIKTVEDIAKLNPIIDNFKKNKDLGFLVTRTPSGGYHVGFLTDKLVNSHTKIFSYPDSDIHVDYRTMKTQCVVMDTAGKYNVENLPDAIINCSFEEFETLLVNKGFERHLGPIRGQSSILRTYVQQYLDGEDKPDSVDTNAWIFGIIRYLMGIYPNDDDMITEKATEALARCKDTSKDENWVKGKVAHCLENQEPLSMTGGRPDVVSKWLFELYDNEIAKLNYYCDELDTNLYELVNGMLYNRTATVFKRLINDFNLTDRPLETMKKIMMAKSKPRPEVNNHIIILRDGKNVADYANNTIRELKPDDVAELQIPRMYIPKKDRDYGYFWKMLNRVKKEYRYDFLSGVVSAFSPYQTEKMTFLDGHQGTGKTAICSFLVRCLGDSAMSTTISNLLERRVTFARLPGKLLLYLQESTIPFKQLDEVKTLTGESYLEASPLYLPSHMFKNRVTTFLTSNQLPPLPSKDRGPFTERVNPVDMVDSSMRDSKNRINLIEEQFTEHQMDSFFSWIFDLYCTGKFNFRHSNILTQRYDDVSDKVLKYAKQVFKFNKKSDETYLPSELVDFMSENFPDKNIRFDQYNVENAIKNIGSIKGREGEYKFIKYIPLSEQTVQTTFKLG